VNKRPFLHDSYRRKRRATIGFEHCECKRKRDGSAAPIMQKGMCENYFICFGHIFDYFNIDVLFVSVIIDFTFIKKTIKLKSIEASASSHAFPVRGAGGC
jgi:hypothetical protein